MKNKSFTLIELLVVIAVIGLLASIVIVNLTGTRSKANIARGLQFNQSIHHALGAYAVGVWSFDEGSGTIANDASGYGNNGTLVNGPVWRCASTDPNYTPSGPGCSLQFDGADDYVDMGDILDQPENDFTISAWVKSTSTATGNNNGIVYKRATGYSYSSGYRLNMPNGAFNLHIANGITSTSLSSGSGYNNGNWHHVAGIVKRNDELRIYVDGVSVANTPTTLTGSIDSTVNLGIGALVIGTSYYHPFNGLIDDVRIYEKALETAQVEELYYAGLQKLLSEGKINEQEYQLAINN